MADHETAVELFYDGGWQAAPTYTRDSITVSRGAPGEGQQAPPSTAALTLDNRDGNANPRNPTGALYGLAGRNTPMRVSADGSVRSLTEAAAWRPQRALVGDAWTSVDGGGLLRRLQQGTTPLKAPLPRAILADPDVVAYWPLDDGKDSDLAASGLPGGTPLTEDGVVAFAAVDGPAGAPAPAPDLVSGNAWVGGLSGPVVMAATGEWSVDYWIQLASDDLPTALGGGVTWRVSGTYGAYLWHIRFEEDQAVLRVDNDGDVDTDSIIATCTPFDGQMHHIRVCAQQDGSDADVQFYVDAVLADTRTGTGKTIGVITQVYVGDYAKVIPPKYEIPTAITSTAVSSLVIRNGGTDTAGSDDDAGSGYDGESAGDRFLRLGVEEGVNTIVDGDESDTQLMGPQSSDTLVNLLRECVRTDDGLMYEPRDELGVVMRPGRSRYNQASVLDLSYTASHIAPTLQPVLDDQGTRNDVVAVRRNGSSARAVKTSGPLNVNDPIVDPDGVGRFDTSIDVNTATDVVLLDHANWHVHKGTVDEPRYPQVTVDLDADTSLIPDVNGVELGDRITIGDLPVDWSPDGASLLVLGIRESLPALRRLVTFVTVPASPFEIGIVGANDGSTDLRGQAIDTDNSTLNASITYNATSLSVASTGGVLWTTDADDWSTSLNGTGPYGGGLFIVVGGEVMRVTDITGGSSPQTFTVVRSVNGVIKSHLAGAPVHVRYPVRVGL